MNIGLQMAGFGLVLAMISGGVHAQTSSMDPVSYQVGFEPLSRQVFLERAMEQFDSIDKNRDGVISEIERNVFENHKKGPPKPTMEGFTRTDLDGSGGISFSEYRSAFVTRAGVARHFDVVKLKIWFDGADEDASGFISRNEWLNRKDLAE